MTDVEKEEMSNIISESVGEVLKTGREAAGLSIADVSERLHLKTYFIEALEADDYDALPSRVFALGYLRKYAKLLNLDENKLVEAEASVVPEENEQVHTLYQPRESDFGAAKTSRRSSGGIVGKLLSLLLILLLLAVGAMWWMGLFNIPGLDPNSVNQMLPFTQQTQEQQETTTEPLQPAMPEQGESIQLRLDSPVVDQSITLPQETVPKDEVVSDAIIPLQIEAAPEPVAVETIESREITPEELDATPSGGEATAEAEPVAAVQSGIVLKFEKGCWVDVRNQYGMALLNGMYDGGTVETITDKGPISFILGDATAVTMLVDGEPFDMSPYLRGNVARFTYEPGSNN